MSGMRGRRPAARILLLDPADRILLFRFDPGDRPPFWVTPGGALDPGEDYPAGARRELLEETGLDLDCGPEVARRLVEFVTLANVPVIADERYFLVRAPHAEIATTGHTELEQRVMREWRWFTRAELATHDEPVFPLDLLPMLEAVLTQRHTELDSASMNECRLEPAPSVVMDPDFRQDDRKERR